jgi:hypothetical protein
MLRRVSGALLAAISTLLVAFLFLHLSALSRVWGTPALPDEWPSNVAIAMLVGVLGVFGLRQALRMLGPSASKATIYSR